MVTPAHKVGEVHHGWPQPENEAHGNGLFVSIDVMIDVLMTQQDVAVDADTHDGPQRTAATRHTDAADDVTQHVVGVKILGTNIYSNNAPGTNKG